MGFSLIDLLANLVPVWPCTIQRGPLLQHTSFEIFFVRASDAIDQMLICCIALFQYISIISRCGDSANAFATRCDAQLTVSKSLALINGRLFHMLSSRSLPVSNTGRVMSEWPNRWMMRPAETTDRGVDTACGCDSHCLCVWFVSVARVRSGFIMIAWASGLGMGVGMFSRPRRGVGVLAMLDAGLDMTPRIKSVCVIPLGSGAVRLLVPGVAVRVIIDRRCVADGVEVTRWVISATRELFSEDVGVEFWPWIVEVTQLPPWEESLSPAGTKTRLLAGGSSEFPEGPRFCWFWRLARLGTFRTTGDVTGWGL